MNVTYTGKIELIGTQTDNVEAKFAKLSKLLERRGEKQAHVILDHFKGQHRAEITMNYLDHTLVGQHEDPDQFTAINAAIDKLEKQALRLRQRRRAGKKKSPREVRSQKSKAVTAASVPPRTASAPVNGSGRVFRVAEQKDRKPMTLEEAILEIERDGDYCVFRDAATDRLSVLLRRPDGNFDLIES
jgi:ribosomal subunit interface protein